MTENDLDTYLARGRHERAKAFAHGGRWIARTLTRFAQGLRAGLTFTHQPKVYQ